MLRAAAAHVCPASQPSPNRTFPVAIIMIVTGTEVIEVGRCTLEILSNRKIYNKLPVMLPLYKDYV